MADEAAKLFGALGVGARPRRRPRPGPVRPRRTGATSARDVNEHIATGGAECTYCPICRTVHVVRQTSPEVRSPPRGGGRVADAGGGRDLLATAVPDEHRAGAARGDGVEHIDLDDERVARGGDGVSLSCGIDVGGTKIAGGVVDDDGNVLEQLRVESPARDVEAIEDAIAGPGRPSWPPTTTDRGGRGRRGRLRRQGALDRCCSRPTSPGATSTSRPSSSPGSTSRS